MSWDFSGNQPDIIVYETQAPVSKRFRANFIEKRVDENGEETSHEWLIYFDATTFEGAIKRADLWWLAERAKQDAAVVAGVNRLAGAAIAREQKAIAKQVAL